jgi:hypothetical protein
MDGLVSQAGDVTGRLPRPDMRVKDLVTMFAKHNLTTRGMVTLSGAHTVGFAHCTRFTDRLYRLSGGGGSGVRAAAHGGVSRRVAAGGEGLREEPDTLLRGVQGGHGQDGEGRGEERQAWRDQKSSDGCDFTMKNTTGPNSQIIATIFRPRKPS